MYCLNEAMAYLIGVILGDGHISNSTKSEKDLSKDYRISIEIADEEFLKDVIFPIMRCFTNSKSLPRSRKRKNKKRHYRLEIRHKKFYYFLTDVIKIPAGNKCGTIIVPKLIKKSDYLIKRNFVAGFFDADGGFRGGSIGITTKSGRFLEEFSMLLDELGIEHSKESWLNKKYQTVYFGLRLRKKSIVKFLKEIPLRNLEKLEKIYNRFGLLVGVPERSNGMGLGD